jgi:MerR family mercuric resistance operon transcriptional regulator
MDNTEESLAIGPLAQRARVNVETVRFYQRRGLMSEPDRPLGGIRRYGQADVSRVAFIKAAQRLGFSLDEIAELLQLDDGASCAQARRHAEHKLGDVRAKIADLRRIERVLNNLVSQCTTARGQVRCPLIVSLQSVPA